MTDCSEFEKSLSPIYSKFCCTMRMKEEDFSNTYAIRIYLRKRVLEKVLKFLKIGKGDKLAVECVLKDNIFETFFSTVYDVSQKKRKHSNFEKLDTLMKCVFFQKHRIAFILLKSIFNIIGEREISMW